MNTFHCVPRVLNMLYSVVCTSITSNGCDISTQPSPLLRTMEARQLAFYIGATEKRDIERLPLLSVCNTMSFALVTCTFRTANLRVVNLLPSSVRLLHISSSCILWDGFFPSV